LHESLLPLKYEQFVHDAPQLAATELRRKHVLVAVQYAHCAAGSQGGVAQGGASVQPELSFDIIVVHCADSLFHALQTSPPHPGHVAALSCDAWWHVLVELQKPHGSHGGYVHEPLIR
jgi:hypothetical protein